MRRRTCTRERGGRCKACSESAPCFAALGTANNARREGGPGLSGPEDTGLEWDQIAPAPSTMRLCVHLAVGACNDGIAIILSILMSPKLRDVTSLVYLCFQQQAQLVETLNASTFDTMDNY